jgi:hypothetical protein
MSLMKCFCGRLPPAILLVVLVGCGSSNGARGPVASSTNLGAADDVHLTTLESLPAAKATYTAVALARNPTGMYASGGMSVKILKVGFNSTIEAAHARRSGYVWELFRVTIRNDRSSGHPFSTLDFACVDEVGNAYHAGAHLASRPNLGSGNVPAGGERQGWIGCEIPRRGTEELAITWDNRSELIPPAEIAKYKIYARTP